MTPITITHSDPHTPSCPFTPSHVSTTVTFAASRSGFSFEYQYNPKYSAPTEADFAHAILLDADAYDENPFTFADGLSMPTDTEAEQQEAFHNWRECRRAVEFVQGLTQHERDFLIALATKADDYADD